MTILPTRLDLIRLLPQDAEIAEIGIHRGQFAAEMLNLPQLGHLYLIDPWAPVPGYDDPMFHEDHEANYQTTLANLKGHLCGGRVTIIRKTSLEGSLRFASGGLDAVYIDADHSFSAVLNDFGAWARVVRPDGWIMGHDYTEKNGFGVIRAVNEFCESSGYALEYLTDEEYPSYALKKQGDNPQMNVGAEPPRNRDVQ